LANSGLIVDFLYFGNSDYIGERFFLDFVLIPDPF